MDGGQEAAVAEAAVGQEKTLRLRLRKEPVGREKTLRLRLRWEPAVGRPKKLKQRLRQDGKVGREKTLRLRLRQEAKVGRSETLQQRLRKRLRQEAPVAEAAEAQEAVVNLEAAVNCSTPNTNTSYESLLRWGENLEPTDENSNGAHMEVDFHINQLAAACDAVSWNVVEDNVKMDGSEETVESVEEEIQADSHTIVDSVLDEMVDLAVNVGGYHVPNPSDASDTSHDSGP